MTISTSLAKNDTNLNLRFRVKWYTPL